MTLLLLEGFDVHTSTSILLGGWTGAGINVTTGRIAGQAMCSTFGASVTLLSPSVGNNATLIAGFAFKRASTPASPALIMNFYETATVQCSISHNADGSISAYRGNLSTLLGTSAAGVLTAATWQYIEVLGTIDPSAGVLQVRVDGSSVLSLTGQNTRTTANSYANRVQFGSLTNTNTTFDDLYILNNSGGSHNTFLGDSRVVTLRPTSDASVTWGRSTGSTNYTLVDDTTYNAADYVVSTTPGQIDRYGMANIGFTPATVHAVMLNMVHQKTDAGFRTIRAFVKSGATTQNGTTVAPLLNTDALTRDLIILDPDTGAAWTGSAVDAHEAGIEVVT